MRRKMLLASWLIAGLLFLLTPFLANRETQAGAAPQQGSTAQKAPESKPAAPLPDESPKVGEEAPDFTLPSGASMTPLKLSDYRGKKNVLLAFYVFDWTGG